MSKELIDNITSGDVLSEENFFKKLFLLRDIAKERCIQGIVESYDRTTHIAVVKPIVQHLAIGSDNYVPIDRAQVSVRVVRTCHGGFFMDFPVRVGDTGWLIAGDRDADGVMGINANIVPSGIGNGDGENRGAAPADTANILSFENGLFIPDNWANIPIADKHKESLIIKQINPDNTSWGEYIIERDGTTHVVSTRHKEIIDGVGVWVGGKILFDLKYRYSDEFGKESWEYGTLDLSGNFGVDGNVSVNEIEDEDGKKHGGFLSVIRDLTVKGLSFLKGKVEIGSKKKAIIDPDADLAETNAKFREIMMVTGIDKDNTGNGKVTLKVQTVRALVDLPTATEPISFEVGTAGGGGGESVEAEITISGNGGGSHTGKSFLLTTGTDSNVVVSVSDGTVKFDVYYV